MRTSRLLLVFITLACVLSPTAWTQAAGGLSSEDLTPLLRFKEYAHVEKWEKALEYVLSCQCEDGAFLVSIQASDHACVKGGWEAAQALDVSGYTDEAEAWWEWMKRHQIGSPTFHAPIENLTGGFYGSYRWNEGGLFQDDFNGDSLDATKWYTYFGNPVVSGGNLDLTNGVIYSHKEFHFGTLEFNASLGATTIPVDVLLREYPDPGNTDRISFTYGAYDQHEILSYYDGAATNKIDAGSWDTSWHIWKIIWENNRISLYKDNVLQPSMNITTNINLNYNRIKIDTAAYGSNTLLIDWIKFTEDLGGASGKWEHDPTLGEGGAASYTDFVGYFINGVYGHYTVTENATWLMGMWPSILNTTIFLDKLNRTVWGYTPADTFWVGYYFDFGTSTWKMGKGSLLEYDCYTGLAYRTAGLIAEALSYPVYAQKWLNRANKVEHQIFTRWWCGSKNKFINSISDIGWNDTEATYFNQYEPGLYFRWNLDNSKRTKILAAFDACAKATVVWNTTDWLAFGDFTQEIANTYYTGHFACAYILYDRSSDAERMMQYVMDHQLEDGSIPDVWYKNETNPYFWKFINVPTILSIYANIRWQLPIEYLIYEGVPSSGSSSYSDSGFNRTTVDGVSSFDMWIQQPKRAIVRVYRNGRTYFNWHVDTAAARLTITGFASDLIIRIIDPHPVIVRIYNALIAFIAAVLSALTVLRRRLGKSGLIVVGLVLTLAVIVLIIFAPDLARFMVHWTEGTTPA